MGSETTVPRKMVGWYKGTFCVILFCMSGGSEDKHETPQPG